MLALLIRRGAAVTAAGMTVGLIAAAFLARLVVNQIYGGSANDPITYATAATVVSATALLATGLPPFRASRENVANALRNE